MTASAQGRRWYLWSLLGLVLLAAAFFFDAPVQQWVANHQTHFANSFMRTVSKWGDWPLHVAVGVMGAALAWKVGSKKWMTIFAAMVMACALAGLLNPVLKAATGRSRPSVTTNVGWNGPSLGSKYHAFPSGHAVASTAFFTTLVCARGWLGALFIPIPLLIAISRIYVNAHHLSDVVAGALLGVCCAIFVWRFVSANDWERRLPSRLFMA